MLGGGGAVRPLRTTAKGSMMTLQIKKKKMVALNNIEINEAKTGTVNKQLQIFMYIPRILYCFLFIPTFHQHARYINIATPTLYMQPPNNFHILLTFIDIIILRYTVFIEL